MRRLALFLLLLAVFLPPIKKGLAAPVAPPTPEAAQASERFDPRVATDAWLATVTPEQKAKSDAYFEGGYWLQGADFLVGVAVFLIFLETRLTVRMRRVAERVTRFRWLQTALTAAMFIAAYVVVTSPLAIYDGFFREHKYGLSNQNFPAWMNDQLIGIALSLVFGSIVIAVLFAIVRRLPRTWHIWAAIAMLGFSILAIVFGPVFIAPLFNKYTPLPQSKLRDQILSLARANGIPASDVYEFNASKQSKRVSANVSGVFGTDRISVNDNLLNRCSPECVLAVLGHEMGHYVINHIYKTLLYLTVYFFAALWIFRAAIQFALRRFGAHWGIDGTTDVAALPLALLVFSVIAFLSTPITNSYTRTQEYEADIFGLNAARQPDGEAEADVLLGEYRKLDPTPFEEFWFYDHPGGRTRIHAAMRWKAENLCLFNPTLPCASPPATSNAAIKNQKTSDVNGPLAAPLR